MTDRIKKRLNLGEKPAELIVPKNVTREFAEEYLIRRAAQGGDTFKRIAKTLAENNKRSRDASIARHKDPENQPEELLEAHNMLAEGIATVFQSITNTMAAQKQYDLP